MINIGKKVARYNVFIRQVRLQKCRGFALKNKNSYVILLNTDLAKEVQAHTAIHELCHIILGHLDDRRYLTAIEKEIEAELMMKKFF